MAIWNTLLLAVADESYAIGPGYPTAQAAHDALRADLHEILTGVVPADQIDAAVDAVHAADGAGLFADDQYLGIYTAATAADLDPAANRRIDEITGHRDPGGPEQTIVVDGQTSRGEQVRLFHRINRN